MYLRFGGGWGRRGAGRGGWATDYPEADENFSLRLSQITTLNINRADEGQFQHAIVQLDGDQYCCLCDDTLRLKIENMVGWKFATLSARDFSGFELALCGPFHKFVSHNDASPNRTDVLKSISLHTDRGYWEDYFERDNRKRDTI